MQPATGGPPTQSASRMWRSSDGKTRIDLPQTSVISDPASQHTIVLDHLKKEASIIPMTPTGAPSMPGVPGAPTAPTPPSVHVQDLGKSMIAGHEVEGKRFTMPTPPTLPKPPMPAMPAAKMPGLKMPGVGLPGVKMPAAPGAPKPPGAPAPPAMPKPPSVTEMWTSVKLKTPVLTKVTTPSGELTTYCKPTLTAEHPPSVFQIPPGYAIKPPDVKPPNAKPPSVKPPAVKFPGVTPPKP
jgi:hypothetical protein